MEKNNKKNSKVKIKNSIGVTKNVKYTKIKQNKIVDEGINVKFPEYIKSRLLEKGKISYESAKEIIKKEIVEQKNEKNKTNRKKNIINDTKNSNINDNKNSDINGNINNDIDSNINDDIDIKENIDEEQHARAKKILKIKQLNEQLQKSEKKYDEITSQIEMLNKMREMLKNTILEKRKISENGNKV